MADGAIDHVSFASERWSDEQLAQVRNDTPGCSDFFHFDNAGASPMPEPAYRRMLEHLELERQVGGYTAHRIAQVEVEGLYKSIATLINSDPAEIAFAESATRAWDMAFYGLDFSAGDKILTTRSEYVSNYLAFLQLQKRTGVVIRFVPDLASGAIDLQAFANMLDSKVKLVNICHIPTSNGAISDIAAIGRLLRNHSALYMVDACQSVGQMPVDVDEIGCDILSATGRKFLRGPRGTGFLYVRSNALEHINPPFADLRSCNWIDRCDFTWASGSRRFETWESSVASKLGLKAAIDYALDLNLEHIKQRLFGLANKLRSVIEEISGVEILDRGSLKSGIVTLASDRVCAEQIQSNLALANISSTVIHADEARLDIDGTKFPSILRLSPHYFVTNNDLEYVRDQIARAVK